MGMSDRRNGGGLDPIDEKLIGLLSTNARMTLTALAHAIPLSRTAVQARIAKLEREGVILGYRAVLGKPAERKKLGAVLNLVFSRRPCAPVVEMFRHWPQIEAYYSLTGPMDGLAIVKVLDSEELSQLINRLSALPGVAQVTSSVIL